VTFPDLQEHLEETFGRFSSLPEHGTLTVRSSLFFLSLRDYRDAPADEILGEDRRARALEKKALAERLRREERKRSGRKALSEKTETVTARSRRFREKNPGYYREYRKKRKNGLAVAP
jgi:hypothetical protein